MHIFCLVCDRSSEQLEITRPVLWYHVPFQHRTFHRFGYIRSTFSFFHPVYPPKSFSQSDFFMTKNSLLLSYLSVFRTYIFLLKLSSIFWYVLDRDYKPAFTLHFTWLLQQTLLLSSYNRGWEEFLQFQFAFLSKMSGFCRIKSVHFWLMKQKKKKKEAG